ncbi:hypothetical protein [Leptospira santarosai]|nr:hypothetical protein [Leptospira santarosai]
MGHSAGSEIATQQKAIPMGRLSKIAERVIEGSHRKMNAPAIPFFGYIL